MECLILIQGLRNSHCHRDNQIMNQEFLNLIDTFESSSKSKSTRYKDFLAHVYTTFDKKMNLYKTNRLMNKYKKMRESVLRYILANEKSITAEICKNK